MILAAIGPDISCGGEVSFWGYMAAAVLGIYALSCGHPLIFDRWTSFIAPLSGGFVYCFALQAS